MTTSTVSPNTDTTDPVREYKWAVKSRITGEIFITPLYFCNEEDAANHINPQIWELLGPVVNTVRGSDRVQVWRISGSTIKKGWVPEGCKYHYHYHPTFEEAKAALIEQLKRDIKRYSDRKHELEETLRDVYKLTPDEG